MKEKFRAFEQRYKRIVNDNNNPSSNHERLKAFIFSKINIAALVDKSNKFDFNFDDQSKKLTFCITNGICNRDASDILHYFRNYDEEAHWFMLQDRGSTKRIFEMDLGKVGDQVLNDFERFIKGICHDQEKNKKQEYIKPYKIINLNNPSHRSNKNTKCSMSNALAKFAGLFVVGVAAGVTYQLIQNDPEGLKRVLGN